MYACESWNMKTENTVKSTEMKFKKNRRKNKKKKRNKVFRENLKKSHVIVTIEQGQ